ncbi:Y-box-binding protein 2-A [Portunus trituberculatus]|uniref:Y-box-binding protein 2-A n=1 Tax=Portunus trituberculatus TaxID=210409 RepID=A0A5B7FXT5_PORTR|nr:Y-box-binding protein 2-A [Portunus trituberculatus]
MASPRQPSRLANHHFRRVKWYNVKTGYGFIKDLQTATDIFVHVSGITRFLKKNPPKEDNEIIFNVHGSDKGPEARETGTIAGGENHRLQSLIPLLLQHSNLPGTNTCVSYCLPTPNKNEPPRRKQPRVAHQKPRENAKHPYQETSGEEAEEVMIINANEVEMDE